MITETGKVVAVENDCLWVETIQRSTCQSCAAEKGCGQSLVAKWGGHTSYLRVLLEGRSQDNYKLHDEVTIGVPEEVVANGSLFVYLVPLITLVLATLLGNALGFSEGATILTAAAGFLLGGGVVRWHSVKTRSDSRLQPVLIDGTKPVVWASS